MNSRRPTRTLTCAPVVRFLIFCFCFVLLIPTIKIKRKAAGKLTHIGSLAFVDFCTTLRFHCAAAPRDLMGITAVEKICKGLFGGHFVYQPLELIHA